MSNSAAAEKIQPVETEIYGNANWIEKVSDAFLGQKVNRHLKLATRVHPCIINNKRVLVYERGLAIKNPDAFDKLREYAEVNGFGLKEDQQQDDQHLPQDLKNPGRQEKIP